MTTDAELYSALKYRVDVDECGTRVHYNAQGYLHCEEGPAIEYTSGCKAWYQNGLRHRIDGPAIEYTSGCKEWYQNGLRHRIDGPAIEWPDGSVEWWLNGKRCTKQNYHAQLKTLGQTP